MLPITIRPVFRFPRWPGVYDIEVTDPRGRVAFLAEAYTVLDSGTDADTDADSDT